MNIRFHLAVIGLLGATCAFGATVDVPADSDETLGMIKISKTNAVDSEIVLGVPFMQSPWGTTNTVSSLLVAGYGVDMDNYKGDALYIWDPAKPTARGYNTWMTWPDANGSNKWVSVSDGVEKAPGSSVYTVNRGTAFWFADVSGDTNDLVTAGLVKTGAVSVVVAGTADEPVKTLLINPFYTEVNAAEALATGAQTGDQLALVGGTKRYEYQAGTAEKPLGWGTWQKGDVIKTIGTIKIYGPDKFVVEDVIPVPAGTGFWYISKGGAPVVTWDTL